MMDDYMAALHQGRFSMTDMEIIDELNDLNEIIDCLYTGDPQDHLIRWVLLRKSVLVDFRQERRKFRYFTAGGVNGSVNGSSAE